MGRVKSTIYHCATCGKTTNYATTASTSCSGCKKKFCCNFFTNCYAKHYDQCDNPRAITITNPQWINNISINMEKDEKLDKENS